jgi:hypothetical protein
MKVSTQLVSGVCHTFQITASTGRYTSVLAIAVLAAVAPQQHDLDPLRSGGRADRRFRSGRELALKQVSDQVDKRWRASPDRRASTDRCEGAGHRSREVSFFSEVH